MTSRDRFFSSLTALVVLPLIAAYVGSTRCPAYSFQCDSSATALHWGLITLVGVALMLAVLGLVRAVRAWRYHRSFY